MLRFSADGQKLIAADAKGFVQQWLRGDGKWIGGRSFDMETSDTFYGTSQHDDSLVAFPKTGSPQGAVKFLGDWQGPAVAIISRSQFNDSQHGRIDASRKWLAIAYEPGRTRRRQVGCLERGRQQDSSEQNVRPRLELSRRDGVQRRFPRLVLGFDQGLIVYDTSDFRQITLNALGRRQGRDVQPEQSVPCRRRKSRADHDVECGHGPRGRDLVQLAESGKRRMFDVQPGWRFAGRVQWRIRSRLEPRLRTEKLVLLGHAGGIPCVAFRGDGEIMTTGSKNRQVRLWDPKSGKLMASIQSRPALSKPSPFRRTKGTWPLAIGKTTTGASRFSTWPLGSHSSRSRMNWAKSIRWLSSIVRENFSGGQWRLRLIAVAGADE